MNLRPKLVNERTVCISNANFFRFALMTLYKMTSSAQIITFLGKFLQVHQLHFIRVFAINKWYKKRHRHFLSKREMEIRKLHAGPKHPTVFESFCTSSLQTSHLPSIFVMAIQSYTNVCGYPKNAVAISPHKWYLAPFTACSTTGIFPIVGSYR